MVAEVLGVEHFLIVVELVAGREDIFLRDTFAGADLPLSRILTELELEVVLLAEILRFLLTAGSGWESKDLLARTVLRLVFLSRAVTDAIASARLMTPGMPIATADGLTGLADCFKAAFSFSFCFIFSTSPMCWKRREDWAVWDFNLFKAGLANLSEAFFFGMVDLTLPLTACLPTM